VNTRMLLLILLLPLCFSAFAELAEKQFAAEYIPLTPDFVVNLQGGRRNYLRANLQLLAENKEYAEQIALHLPAVRHAMILLISEYSADQLSTSQQREEFRKEALTEIRKTLDKYASSKGLSDLFFTEFLVQ
jgi:flagellar protein FliL